jgi:xanthine dehydrogenase accessory factor
MLIERIPELIAQNRSVALVTVTSAGGSTPAEAGKEMLVDQTGNIGGTIGGGNLEFVSVKKAQESLARNISAAVHYDLKKDLGMDCGGEVDIFIKVYSPPIRLVIVGAGHIGRVLYQYADALGYDMVVIDDREEVATRSHYPNARQILVGDIGGECEKLDISPPTTYVVIATHGHKCDEIALYHMVRKDPKYIGVIGSRNKVAVMMENLERKGIPKNKLDAVYAPVGIALGGDQPAEIAVSIISEILLIKNAGKLAHMKSLPEIRRS